MRKLIFVAFVCALGTTVALANPTGDVVSPHLGGWPVDASRTTHQYWTFDEPYVSQAPSGASYDYSADPTERDNPGTSAALIIEAGLYDPIDAWAFQAGFLDSEEIKVLLEITNYPIPNLYKELWVDIGYVGVLSGGYAQGQGAHGPYTSVELTPPGPSGVAELGFQIYPNPDKEDISFQIASATPGIGLGAGLLWVHVDTICIPAPGAILLGSIGVGLVGWLRRRRTL